MNLIPFFSRIVSLFILSFCALQSGFVMSGPNENKTSPNDSYWFKAKASQETPALAKDAKFDIAIIGGGYTGLSSAWHLANENPELNIAIFEAKHVGHGASGRNGGMVLPGSEVIDFIEEGQASADHYKLTVNSMRRLQTLVNSTGIDANLVLDGYVEAILDEEDIDYYTEHVQQANRLGVPLQYWEAEKTQRQLGSDRYVGAVYDPNGGHVHAVKLVNALRKAVEQQGVVIYENSPVTAIKEGKKIELRIADQYKVTANDIVLATNGYTSKLGYFKNRLFPVHTQSAVTEPLTQEQINKINWQSRLPFYDTRKLLFHLVLTPDNRIVIGGGNAEYFYNDGLAYKGDLNAVSDLMMTELTTIYPSLKGIKFESVWNGILGMTSNSNEIVGVTGEHENVYYALGYNGHGVNLSFLFGEIVATLYKGQQHPWFSHAEQDLPFKLPPEPLKSTGVKSTLMLYKKQDESHLKH